jgi:hypothetical protein
VIFTIGVANERKSLPYIPFELPTHISILEDASHSAELPTHLTGCLALQKLRDSVALRTLLTSK